MSKDREKKKDAKVGGFEFEVIVSSLSGDLSKKVAEALEKKLEKEEKRG
jgi:diphthamide synthase subunit DPH2